MADKKIRRKKNRFIILLIIFSLVIFFLVKLGTGLKAMFGDKDVSLKKISSIEYTQKKKDAEKICIESFNEYIIKFEKNKLSTYNKDGDKVWEKDLSIDDAIIKGNKDVIVAVDSVTGGIYYIDYEGKTKVEKSVDEKVIDVKINDSGYVLIMLENEIYVFDPQGEIASNFTIPKGEVFDGDLTKDNSKIALTILAVEDEKFYSNVIFYSLDGKILAGKKYDNEIIYKIFLVNNSNLLVLGDNKISMIAEAGDVLWQKKFEETLNKGAFNDKGLLGINLISKNSIIIDTKNRNIISLLDIDGNVLNKTSIPGEVLGLDIIDDKVVTFTERTIYIIEKNGNKILEKKINKDIKNVSWISAKNLLVTFKDKLEIMSINY